MPSPLARRPAATIVPVLAGLLAWAEPTAPVAAAEADCRRVPLTHDGQPVTGPEDIAFDPVSRTLILSADDRLGQAGGGLFGLRLDDLAKDIAKDIANDIANAGADADDGQAPPLVRLWPPERAGMAGFSPHGVGFDPGSRRLAVIDHGTPSRLDVFVVDGQGRLSPQAPVLDPRLDEANDVVPDGAGGWLVTLDHGSESRLGKVLEDVFALARGKVIRAGDPDAVLAADILFANGLLRGAEDRLYVAATRADIVAVFGGDGARLARLEVPGGPDNLSFAPDGRILAAVIPSTLRLGFALMGFGVTPPGGRVVAVDAKTGAVEVLFDDPEGRILRAATSAVAAEGMLVIGSVTEPAIALCRDAFSP